MDLREEQVDGVTALSVKGRIDSTTAPVLGQMLEAVVSAPASRLVVDFRDLEYISSAGFRVLLVAAKRAEEARAVAVVPMCSASMRRASPSCRVPTRQSSMEATIDPQSTSPACCWRRVKAGVPRCCWMPANA